jgi:hypothetical protein
MVCAWATSHIRWAQSMAAISKLKTQSDEKLSRLLIALKRRGETVTFDDYMITVRSETGSALYGVPNSQGLQRAVWPSAKDAVEDAAQTAPN